MHHSLLDILACPSCHAPLRLSDPPEARACEIETGSLGCTGCGVDYPIRKGIPRLLPRSSGLIDENQRKTGRHFELEFTALSEEDRDVGDPRLVEYYFYTRTGMDPAVYEQGETNYYRTELPGDAYRPDPSALRDRRVLDGGCGPGRLTRVAAEARAARVVGLDFGDHIERAARYCADLDNVDFVQGSILEPPFLPGSFDVAFSLGVLHHTPDPRRGCLELARLLGPGGVLSVWVYPPEYWCGAIRGRVNRAMHALVTRMSRDRALSFCRRVLYPIGRLQGALAVRPSTKYLAAPLFLLSIPRHPHREVMIATIYDYFGPAIISTHDPAEVEHWMHEAGLERVRRLPVPSSCRGERPACSNGQGR
jgi:SAM-dependent methyltransferase/uncharacterized protein YbaR (Trm112 family)